MADHIDTQNDLNTDSVHPSFPVADGLNNIYVRILQTNSIHHMAMVTCQYRGENLVPMDLVACWLLPASFKKIWTLFSVQLMDHFCLCNLELKATAYQFYQLIHRMTTPIGQTKIVNVYHEFCSLEVLKKLRWAEYGHKAEDPHNPPAGSLSLYCPTCPQPGINLPTDWKDDPNWLLQYASNKILFLTCHQCSTVYKCMFVTNGNFKADHVWQKYNNNIWLMDRSGMAPNKDDYHTF
ncbi:hypothetical protein CVT25_006240 [Psilocybe cyanescens]|uniref:CxC2-like cysteine cluster KDZ transposase-associated domain-containing protein n=1 Tax=Psilocybe cyanescens TaxID=93625 RepID=A0A409XQN3_PSICY|nr:hypothetical protein CVT25_006240 [Psilocybe cyanescens]